MAYVKRDTNGNIDSIFAERQPGMADERVVDPQLWVDTEAAAIGDLMDFDGLYAALDDLFDVLEPNVLAGLSPATKAVIAKRKAARAVLFPALRSRP